MVRPRKQLDVVQVFRGPRVLTLEQVCRRLQASRSTVLRRLQEHGYHSSYNQAGRFLTIDEVADFDARGLWVWRTARFSQQGSLKKTVNYFVEHSPQGMTQEELATLLGVRAHNTLWSLVQEERIRRERLGPTFVYLSRRASSRREQVSRRKSVLAESQKPRPTNRQVIATLLELIEDPQAPRQQLVVRCQRSGVSLSRELLDAVFDKYDLDKKRAP
jgi:transcriptional regulator with XRE-family HTH domain